MNFIEKLDQIREQVFSLDHKSLISKAINELRASGIVNQTLNIGDTVPNFTLPNAFGQLVELQTLLNQGAVVISFYRGAWCPFCSLELMELEQTLPAIKMLGATLIAISPQILEYTLLTIQEHELTYNVLIDKNNYVARQFGIVFQVPRYLRDFLLELGYNLAKYNANKFFELPIPATYIVNRNGEIIYAFVEPDHTKRLDPVEIINVLRKLNLSNQ
ncbi:MAG TPA: peroxiredoxin-like family protein [Nostocaceae cyanobacterium]|nr:peroxiredoxin-like family protein [Nostocaceae cyanobacterium]